MTTEQILETIKTLNLNINSESAVQIVQKVMPYFWSELILTFVLNLAMIGMFIVITWIIIRGVIKYKELKYKNNDR
jgi:hypothetical protein